MKDPERLLHGDEDVARLLDAMSKDGPSDAQMQKALSLATNVAAASPPRGAVSSWFGRSWLGRSSVQIGLTMVGLAALIGVSSVMSSVHEPPAVTSPLPVAAAADSVLAVAPVDPAVASVRVDDLPSAPVAPVAPAVSARTRVAASAPVNEAKPCNDAEEPCTRESAARSTFQEELALTSAARAALGRGDLGSCFEAVERYRRTYHGGVFAQEIEVIRIEALARSGAREQARISAEQFLRENTTSPYDDRIRSVLERQGD